MLESKFARLTSRAVSHVLDGHDPESAWVAALSEVYPPGKVESQLKHSCPKWAFAILCHDGRIQGVTPGCCPRVERRTSAGYARKALEALRAEPRLLSDKRELKRRVFGTPDSPNYRQPNDEIEVLLALVDAGNIQLLS